MDVLGKIIIVSSLIIFGATEMVKWIKSTMNYLGDKKP